MPWSIRNVAELSPPFVTRCGRRGATELFTSCVPGEGSPGPFYERLGFVYTGREDDGELVMRREV